MTLKLKKILNALLLVLFLVIGIFAGIAVFDRLLMPTFIRGGGTILIPDIVGVHADTAETFIRKRGFNFRISREEHSDSVKQGYIISQIPEPDSPAKKGRRISVVISSGTAMDTVPDLYNWNIRKASLQIEKSGFKVGEIEYISSDSITKDFVISTNPAAGEFVRLGSKIHIQVSLGAESELIPAPNFVGQSVENIEEFAEDCGVRVVMIYRKIPSVPDKTVYSQNIKPGTPVAKGSQIRVIVAREKE